VGWTFSIRRSSIIAATSFVLLRVVLDFVYIQFVSPIWAYADWSLLNTSISVDKVIISYFALLIILVLMPRDYDRPSKLVLMIHLAVMIIPLMTVYALADLPTSFFLMSIAAFMLQIMLIKRLPRIKLPHIDGIERLCLVVFGFLTLSTYAYLFLTQRINLGVLDFAAGIIHEIRADRIVHPLMQYLITWQFRIVNPVYMVLSYRKKYYILFIFVVAMQILLYLFFPNREVIFSLALIGAALYSWHKGIRVAIVMPLWLSFVSLLSGVMLMATGSLVPLLVFVVRFLFLPARIKFRHYGFFSVHEKLYYSEGLIGRIFGLSSPHPLPSGFMVSGTHSQANTGYIAYAYSNSGFIGMILMSLILVGLLMLIDSLTHNMRPGIVLAMLIYPMVIINDIDLLTSLLNGGLFLLLLYLSGYNRSLRSG